MGEEGGRGGRGREVNREEVRGRREKDVVRFFFFNLSRRLTLLLLHQLVVCQSILMLSSWLVFFVRENFLRRLNS